MSKKPQRIVSEVPKKSMWNITKLHKKYVYLDPDLGEAALGLHVSEILPVFVKVKTLFMLTRLLHQSQVLS